MARSETLEADRKDLDGLLANAVAKMAGIPARYRDPVLGWVREHPDGTVEPFDCDDVLTEPRPRTIRIAR